MYNWFTHEIKWVLCKYIDENIMIILLWCQDNLKSLINLCICLNFMRRFDEIKQESNILTLGKT